MDKNSNAYVVVFAAAVCVVLALGLAGTYHTLKPTIDKNKLFDKQRNVLAATGLYDPEAGAKSQKELESLFAEKVTPKVLEFEKETVQVEEKVRGEMVKRPVERFASAKETDIELVDLPKARKKNPDRILSEVYIAKVDGKNVYCIPISGYGLWSTLYGFLALEADRNTVRGITFYKHGETPGLGGEVEKAWWQKHWKGKTTHDADGNLVGIKVLKGKGNTFPKDGHEVDGISGATITCNGVTNFVKKDLEKYEVWFQAIPNQRDN